MATAKAKTKGKSRAAAVPSNAIENYGDDNWRGAFDDLRRFFRQVQRYQDADRLGRLLIVDARLSPEIEAAKLDQLMKFLSGRFNAPANDLQDQERQEFWRLRRRAIEIVKKRRDRLPERTAAHSNALRTISELMSKHPEGFSAKAAGEPPIVRLANDARDKWLYTKLCKVEVKQPTIMRQLAEQCKIKGWRKITDINAAKQAANRWAERNGKSPIPKRQHGRRTSKAK